MQSRHSRKRGHLHTGVIFTGNYGESVIFFWDVSSRATLNDVERCRNRLVIHEFFSLKASQMCRVHTSSHEVTNEPYVSYQNCASRLNNNKPYDCANNCELDMDTDRSNLNSKYLSLALPLNVPFLWMVFIGFNTCKARFGIAYVITIIVQGIDRKCWFALCTELHVLDKRKTWWILLMTVSY